MNNLRKGDLVIVIAGRDRGVRGNIDRIMLDADGDINYVLVSGVNMAIRHTKPDPMRRRPGGKERKARKIHASNVALYNPDTKRGGRIRIKDLEDGSRVRVFAAGGKEVET